MPKIRAKKIPSESLGAPGGAKASATGKRPKRFGEVGLIDVARENVLARAAPSIGSAQEASAPSLALGGAPSRRPGPTPIGRRKRPHPGLVKGPGVPTRILPAPNATARPVRSNDSSRHSRLSILKVLARLICRRGGPDAALVWLTRALRRYRPAGLRAAFWE